tara:strand:- start:3347 stop:3748 length:402 start_codon:yes stop_codon:yes gene_type:complete
MEKTIEIAKCTLADMFNIRREQLDYRTRERDVIEAKRFLIFFIVNELGIKFAYVSKHIKSIKSHATAMHHYYKLKDLFELKHEAKTKAKYIQFKSQVIEKGMDKLEKELTKQIELKKVVNWNIKQLKQMINES